MAPKRKASERIQAGAGNPLTEHDRKAEAVTASGTLAGASGKSVDTLLGRVGNRRSHAFAAKGTKAKTSAAFPLPKPRAVAEAVCGAPAQGQAAAAEQKAAQQNDEENADLASASDWEWEDAAEEEEDWETAEADVADMPTVVSGVAGSFDVEATEEPGPSKLRRKGITKADRETARLLHRTHLLCLLSRGLLYDEGASDPLLQVTMLSLVPPEVIPPSDTCKGVSPPALQPLLSWFQHTFQQLPPAPPRGPDEDDFAGKAGGLDSVTEQLQAVAVAKQGSAEQLQALFVSLCRAQALLVRSVRVLDPMPLNPGVRRVASAHLKQPRRQKPKPDNAATAISASASAAASTQGVSVTADAPSKRGRGRKRKSAESAETNDVPTSPQASHKASNEKAAEATKRRGKKAADQLTDGVLDNARGSTRTQVQHRQPAAKGKGRGSKGAAEEPDEAELQLRDDMATACAASLVDTQQSDRGAQAAKAKRVGDIELENQLAMAMASTAAEVQHRAQRKPIAKAVHDEPMPSAFSPRSGVPKPTLGETWARDARPANQDLAHSSAASCWAEVFCGSADHGKWVHVDPLLNWLDVPDKVEGAGIRPGGLAYVVAFANRGAKDVTQRYTGSVLAADKLRDNAWWEQTLKPLRKHEVAATTLHHKAQQLPAALQDAHYTQPSQAAGSDLTSPQGRSPAALPPLAAVSGAESGADDKTIKLASWAAELALKREDAELNQRAASERRGLPSNVEGFKHHPVYILERHIGRYFALKPGTKKAGMHRGEGFYPREALAELHTADRWLRDGLEVKTEELAKPYKVVKRRGVKDPPGPHTDPSKGPVDEEDVQEATSVIPVPDSMVTKMYGRWQTQQWEVPTAVGGVVPKNDRGNVHCPPLASELPKGTVHLQMPRLGPICKKLAVDYAPAMTGFDIRGGRSVPVIEGVVVCKEDEATVLEAYIEDERLREERAAERRKQEAHAAWRQLLRSIWTRLRLHQDYGDNAAAHEGQHRADHALLGVSREDLSGAVEVVDLVEDQPGESAGPPQQPKGQLKQPQAASPASDAPKADSQLHDDDQAGQPDGQAKLSSNKRGISTRTTQAQPAAAPREASRQPNGRHYVEEIVKLTTGVVTVIKTATLFFSMIILSAASHRLRATHAGSQHLGFEGCELTEAEEHQRILSELEDHQLRECMLQQAATCASSSAVPAPAPGSGISDDYQTAKTPCQQQDCMHGVAKQNGLHVVRYELSGQHKHKIGLYNREIPSMKFKRATLVLLVLMSITATVAPRRLLTDEFALSNSLEFATENQRILAELEEVHQLRERMLQQAATYTSSSGPPAPAPAPSSSASLSSPSVSSGVAGTSGSGSGAGTAIGAPPPPPPPTGSSSSGAGSASTAATGASDAGSSTSSSGGSGSGQ
ncbi:hypothetical protein WJX77_010735 [Trebouxia sp. C0004]